MTDQELMIARALVAEHRKNLQPGIAEVSASDFRAILRVAERLLDDAIPSLDNGMPRVDWNSSAIRGGNFTAIITEQAPIMLIAGDSGCELVFDADHNDRGLAWTWSGTVRAVRRGPAP